MIYANKCKCTFRSGQMLLFYRMLDCSSGMLNIHELYIQNCAIYHSALKWTREWCHTVIADQSKSGSSVFSHLAITGPNGHICDSLREDGSRGWWFSLSKSWAHLLFYFLWVFFLANSLSYNIWIFPTSKVQYRAVNRKQMV